MKSEIRQKGLIMGSVEIVVDVLEEDNMVQYVLSKMEKVLGDFYKKSVEWKRDNPHTEIRIQPVTRYAPMMMADMPICSKPKTTFIISSRVDSFSPVNHKTWKENFEATIEAIAVAFGQKTVHIEYTDIKEVAVFENVAERM